MAQIATTDKAAMNHLMRVEASRKGVKLAAEDSQAFLDHKEYLATLEEVMKEDKTESWDPNDVLLD